MVSSETQKKLNNEQCDIMNYYKKYACFSWFLAEIPELLDFQVVKVGNKHYLSLSS